MPDQSIRDLYDLALAWIQSIETISSLIGSDAWLDMPVDEFERMADSDNLITQLVLYDAMNATMRQIDELPEVPDT